MSKLNQYCQLDKLYETHRIYPMILAILWYLPHEITFRYTLVLTCWCCLILLNIDIEWCCGCGSEVGGMWTSTTLPRLIQVITVHSVQTLINHFTNISSVFQQSMWAAAGVHCNSSVDSVNNIVLVSVDTTMFSVKHVWTTSVIHSYHQNWSYLFYWTLLLSMLHSWSKIFQCTKWRWPRRQDTTTEWSGDTQHFTTSTNNARSWDSSHLSFLPRELETLVPRCWSPGGKVRILTYIDQWMVTKCIDQSEFIRWYSIDQSQLWIIF